MKKSVLITAVIISIAVAAFLIVKSPCSSECSFKKKANINKELAEINPIHVKKHRVAKYENELFAIKKAGAYIANLKQNQLTGKVEVDDYTNALNQALAIRKAQTGGQRALNLELENIGPWNLGGRTRALAIDPTNSNIMYTGGVAGGIYKTLNGGLSWQAHAGNDELENQAVNAVGLSADGKIFVGTGEKWYGNFGTKTGGVPGRGVYVSYDNGDNFDLITATDVGGVTPNNTWAHTYKIIGHPTDANKVYMVNDGGLYVTQSTSVPGASITVQQLLSGNVSDFDISKSGNRIVAIHNNQLKISNNGGPFATAGAGVTFSGVGRSVVSISKVDENHMFLATAGPQGSDCLENVYHSTNGGLIWSNIGQGGTSFFNPCANSIQCQCSYDFVIKADANRADRCFLAGISLWSWSGSDGWREIDNIGASPLSGVYVHADKHFIEFDPNNPKRMFVCSDGGISRGTNAHLINPTFVNLNRRYTTGQFYSVASGLDGFYIGGTQDNGTYQVDYKASTLFDGKRISGGDGGFTEISKTNFPLFAKFGGRPNGDLFRALNNGGFGSFFDCRIEFDANDGTTNCGAAGIECEGDGELDCDAEFVTAFHLWEDYDLFFEFNDLVDSAGSASGATVMWPQKVTSSGGVISVGSGLVGKDDTIIYNGDTTVIAKNTTLYDATSNYRSISKSRYFTGSSSGAIWMTEGALDFSVAAPDWFKLPVSGGGAASAYGTSSDGDVLYIGYSGGTFKKITGLNATNFFYTQDTTEDPRQHTYIDTNMISTTATPFGGNQYITSIAVDPNDADHVVVTIGRYNQNSRIHRSTDGGVTFSNIHFNLPTMPVYSAIIDFYDSNVIVAGTELGVYSLDLAAGTTWEDESFGNGMGNTPVFMIRQELKDDLGCRNLYFATHGKGIYRSTTRMMQFASNCNPELPANPILSVDDEVSAEFETNIYPNPMNGSGTFEYTLQNAEDVQVMLYDIAGQHLGTLESSRKTAGTHKLAINASDLSNGSYMVWIKAGNQTATKQFVVNR